MPLQFLRSSVPDDVLQCGVEFFDVVGLGDDTPETVLSEVRHHRVVVRFFMQLEGTLLSCKAACGKGHPCQFISSTMSTLCLIVSDFSLSRALNSSRQMASWSFNR